MGQQIDSLIAVGKTAAHDSDRVHAYNRLAQIYSSVDLKKALAYNRQAMELAQKNNMKAALADVYNTSGILYSEQGKTKEAFFCFNTAIGLSGELGNKADMAQSYINAASCHFSLGEYDKALEMNIRGLALFEEANDIQGALDTYVNIANIYASKKDYELAKMYYKKARKGYQKRKDKVGEAAVVANLAGIYKMLQQSDSAQMYFEEVVHLCENENMPYYLAVAWEGLGTIYGQKKEFAKAHQYLNNAYAIYQQIGVVYRCNTVLANQSEVAYSEKKYQESVTYALRALDMALELNEPDLQKGAYSLLHNSYAAMGNYEKAYDYHLKFVTLRDSLFTEDNQLHLNELRTQFETEEKEKENEILANINQIQNLELNRNRYYVGGLIALLLGGALVTWLLIRQYRLRSKQKAIQLEQRLLRSQMNPHFIFNSLNSIQSFIYEHQPKEAGIYLSKFAKLMRLILESSAKEYIPLEKETEILEYYLNLQKLRLHNRFDYQIEVDEALYEEDVHVPPMITQPFIENAVEHGLKHIEGKGHILVRFSLENQSVKIEIRDNGIGIDQAGQRKEHSNNHKSMAMAITKERLLFLNKSKKQSLLFEVTDLARNNLGETGTHIIFTIPLA